MAWRASGLSYDAAVRRLIFDPLGMDDSGYERDYDVVEHRSTGYVGRVGVDLRRGAVVDVSNKHAAGGLYSTAEDMHRWNESIERGTLARPETLAAAFRPEKDGYAYGWRTVWLGGREVQRHAGGSPEGVSTYVARFPADRTYVVLLSNVGSTPTESLFLELMGQLYPP
jgi:CubicO group peptidase (beta-lactamase class C family)